MHLVYISAKGHTKPCLHEGYALNLDLPNVMEDVILRPRPVAQLNESVLNLSY